MITLIRLQAHNFKGLRDVDITFPPQGSILIEGHNEAGKSTLFEAVYTALYGSGLVGEDATPRLEDIVAFGAANATVALTFAHGDTRVHVARQFRRTKPGDIQHVPIVTVYAPDGTEETRHGVTAVNGRILTELGNLDGAALRNSCFVEQKELGRLESLDRGAREKAIERLLGLEQLTKIATTYQKERRHYDNELKTAEQYRDLAVARAAVEQHRHSVAAAQALITTASVAASLDLLDAMAAEDQQLTAASITATQRHTAAKARIALADHCEAWLHDNERLVSIAATVQSRRKTLQASVAGRQQQRDELLTRTIPAHVTLLAHYHHVQATLAAAAAIAKEADDARTTADRTTQHYDALLVAMQDLQAAEQTAARASDAAINASIVTRDAEIRDALADWLRTASASSTVTDIHDQMTLAQHQHTAAHQQLRAAQTQQRQRIIIAAIGVVIGVGLAGAGFILAIPGPLVLAGSIVAIAAIIPLLLSRQTVATTRATEANARQSLRLAEARQEAIAGTTATPALAMVARLEALGVGTLGPSEAQTVLADLQRRVTSSLSAATQAEQAARIQAAAAQIHVDTAHKHLATLVPPTDSGVLHPELVAQAQREAARTLLRNAETRQQHIQATLQSALTAAALPATTDLLAIRGNIAKAESLLETYQQQTEQLAASDDTLYHDIATTLTDLLGQWQTVITRAVTLGLLTESPPDAVTEADILAMQPQLRATVLAQLQQSDKSQAVAAQEAELNLLGGYRQRQEQIQGEITTTRWQINDLLAQHGAAALSAGEVRAFCQQVWPDLATAPTVAHAEASKHDADNYLFAALEHVARLTRETAVPQETIDRLEVVTTVATVAALQRNVAISERALRLITAVRQRIVKMVLPTTERNMRIILPLLTAGRYHDVQLTAPDDEGSDHADYRIYVYESTAGRLVSKSIFSGGARDQCSLALRLAFALATLPQELGIAPGFLFLDEPLSAFDSERATALVQLLTQGEVARAFAQVIVISHQHAFARHDFHYHIRMERGRVVASDLPSAAPAVMVD